MECFLINKFWNLSRNGRSIREKVVSGRWDDTYEISKKILKKTLEIFGINFLRFLRTNFWIKKKVKVWKKNFLMFRDFFDGKFPRFFEGLYSNQIAFFPSRKKKKYGTVGTVLLREKRPRIFFFTVRKSCLRWPEKRYQRSTWLFRPWKFCQYRMSQRKSFHFLEMDSVFYHILDFLFFTLTSSWNSIIQNFFIRRGGEEELFVWGFEIDSFSRWRYSQWCGSREKVCERNAFFGKWR